MSYKSVTAAISFSLLLLAGCGKEEKNDLDVKQLSPAKTKSTDLSGAVKTEKSASEKKKQDDAEYRSPVFELKNWNSDVKKSEVKDNAGNIQREEENDEAETSADNSKAEKLKAPEDSLADEIIPDKVKIAWSPQWDYHGIGGVNLPDAVISPDQSVLAIIEKTGEEKGPNGSRIIIFNTYDWDILRVHEFRENKFSIMRFIGEGNLLAVWEERQQELKRPFALLLIETDSGKIFSSSNAVKKPVCDIAVAGDRIFVKPTGDSPEAIMIFKSSDLSSKPVNVKSENTRGVFAVSPDLNTIAFAGEKSVEIMDAEGNIKEKTPLNAEKDYQISSAVFAGKNNGLAVVSNMKPAYFVKGDKVKMFSDLSGRTAFFNNNANCLAVGSPRNDSIILYSLPELKETGSIIPHAIRPKTQGSIVLISFLKHYEKYIALDSFGNLSMYAKAGKRWKKQIIFSAQK